MRLQLALNVQNINESISYYSKLFDTKPHKIREGYANFSIDNPPLKLVLIENPKAENRINHLGVEVSQDENLKEIIKRLNHVGVIDRKEVQTTCCFATQNKVWSLEPQGLHWKWYIITDDDPYEQSAILNGTCCTLDLAPNNCCQ